MKSFYRIAELSFGYPRWNVSYEFSMGNSHFAVERFAACFSTKMLIERMKALSSSVDAISLVGFPTTIRIGNKSYLHPINIKINSYSPDLPISNGEPLTHALLAQSIREGIEKNTVNPDGSFFFPSAIFNHAMVDILKSYIKNGKFYYGDPFLINEFPLCLRKGFLSQFGLKTTLLFAYFIQIRNSFLNTKNRPIFEKIMSPLFDRIINKCDYICGSHEYLYHFNQRRNFIQGKKFLLSDSHPKFEKQLKDNQVAEIINLFPSKFQLSPYISYSTINAALMLHHNKTDDFSIEELESILTLNKKDTFKTRAYQLMGKNMDSLYTKIIKKIFSRRAKYDFAFIVHPLEFKHIVKGAFVTRILSKIIPMGFLEKALSYLPGYLLGTIENITSSHTQKQTNGLIYCLTITPRMFKKMDPKLIYEKVLGIIDKANARGAKIIGLGAYIKIVGDAGLTINELSPLPVTTGNSLTIGTVLWHLENAVQKIQLVTYDDKKNIYDGTAMIIGATGSIGTACSKMLSKNYKRICLVSPRLENLTNLSNKIQKISPDCEVAFSTNSNQFAAISDVIVIATSAFNQKVIDIEKVKPGCIIADCSAPSNISKEEILKRADILVMKSGELLLPKNYDVNCYLGLPPKLLYACLVETAVLAMENRYEAFTKGRAIDFNKVNDIVEISKKHGVHLAPMRSLFGFIYDREIELIKEKVTQL